MGLNSCQGKRMQLLGMNSRRQRRKWGSRSVQMKVQKLHRVLPGSHGLHLHQLLVYRADYILHLRLQVSLMEALFKMHEP